MATDRRGKQSIKVAIVGGGCAGMAAAWQLAQQPGHEIHVYESSWRLGGKGASMRDANGRIIEHGLHVWMGFYENAFRMMRECYAEVEARGWGPAPQAPGALTHGRIEDAFFPEPHIGVSQLGLSGDWEAWSGYFPPANGLPGTPLDEKSNPFTLANYLLRCFDLLKTLMLSVIGPPGEDVPGKPRPNQRSAHDQAFDLDFSFDTARSARLLLESMAKLLRGGALTSAAALLQGVTMLEVYLRNLVFLRQVGDSAIGLMEAVASQIRKVLRDIVSIDPEIRTRTEIIDILLTIGVGLFKDRVLFDDRGLDAINDVDYRKWLHDNHGGTDESRDSPFVTGAYDLMFAYRDGQRSKPELAAGVALRGALRMFFTYRGAMFWRIRSGMGDAVFAPLYKVLMLDDRKVKDRNGRSSRRPVSGVTFHFLHELEEVRFAQQNRDGRDNVKAESLDSLTFRTFGDPALLDIASAHALDDRGCWPDTPVRFEGALEKGNDRQVLKVGKDFDAVIFAGGIENFRTVFAISESPFRDRWMKMCDEVKTVATQSGQVWLDKNVKNLGWHRGSGLFTAMDFSFNTWADMTHTLAAEQTWRGTVDGAKSVAYFCAPLADSKISEVRRKVAAGISAMRGKLHSPMNPKGKTDTGESLPERLLDLYRAVLYQEIGSKAGREFERLKEELSSAPWAFPPQLRKKISTLMANNARGVPDIPVSDSLRSAIESQVWGLSPQDLTDDVFAKIESLLVKAVLDAMVDADLTRMLASEMAPVWPNAFRNGATALNGEVWRHVQANFEGSDRYTLSLPGTISLRISPLENSVKNMTVAGDWTACGLDAGCVEAAVMSGMLAARAISGSPALEDIVGYDHP